jgi:carbon-monoxide dehydrogenase medium subunit
MQVPRETVADPDTVVRLTLFVKNGRRSCMERPIPSRPCMPHCDRAAPILTIGGVVQSNRSSERGDEKQEEGTVIPGSFAYHRPTSVSDAVALLASLGEEARPLAGGHSLIPMMKLRLAVPCALVDLGAITELRGVRRDGDGFVVGATTTIAALIASIELADAIPVIRETALVIADPQVRARGTIGGNVANGDPGNDMPALMQCLGATYLAISSAGVREVAARDFYQGAYFTALMPGEVITAIRIPIPQPGHGWAYEKLKRKIGDYATAAAGVVLTMQGGLVAQVAIGLTNVGDTPLFAEQAATILTGSTLDKATVDRAVTAAEAITSPASDGRGPAAYRTKMAGMMLRRALARAASRAH